MQRHVPPTFGRSPETYVYHFVERVTQALLSQSPSLREDTFSSPESVKHVPIYEKLDVHPLRNTLLHILCDEMLQGILTVTLWTPGLVRKIVPSILTYDIGGNSSISSLGDRRHIKNTLDYVPWTTLQDVIHIGAAPRILIQVRSGYASDLPITGSVLTTIFVREDHFPDVHP